MTVLGKISPVRFPEDQEFLSYVLTHGLSEAQCVDADQLFGTVFADQCPPPPLLLACLLACLLAMV
jgi:hypothetical protein